MTIEQFMNDLEDAIEDLEAGALLPETDFQSLAVWDSLAVLTVIAMIDAEYGVLINAAQLKVCDSVSSLYQHVKDQSK